MFLLGSGPSKPPGSGEDRVRPLAMTRHITPPDPPRAPPPGGPRAADGSVPPEADAQVEPSPPDLVVEGGHLFVTLDLHIPRDVLAHYVGTNLLVLWRSDDPDREARVIRFPVDVDPARAVIRVVNGVLDLEVPVAESRSYVPSSPPSSDLPLDGSE